MSRSSAAPRSPPPPYPTLFRPHECGHHKHLWLVGSRRPGVAALPRFRPHGECDLTQLRDEQRGHGGDRHRHRFCRWGHGEPGRDRGHQCHGRQQHLAHRHHPTPRSSDLTNAVAINTSGSWGAVALELQPSLDSAPTVSAISPSSETSSGGTAVTVTGTGFAAGATVSLGGTAATNVTVVSSTSLTATTAAHAAGVVNVVVTNSDGQSGTLTGGYTYINSAPTVSAISPSSGMSSGGTAVTVTGTGFAAGATVSLGGTAATNVTVVSNPSLTPTKAGHAARADDVV